MSLASVGASRGCRRQAGWGWGGERLQNHICTHICAHIGPMQFLYRPKLQNNFVLPLHPPYCRYNFMPLARGSAFCGYVSLLGAFLAAGAPVRTKMPKVRDETSVLFA